MTKRPVIGIPCRQALNEWGGFALGGRARIKSLRVQMYVVRRDEDIHPFLRGS